MKRLLPSRVYLPLGGVNWDSPGATINPAEVTDILNLRIRKDRLEIRDGCRRLIPTFLGDKIIHFHTYLNREGQQELFAFGEDLIYRYDATAGSWSIAVPCYRVLEDGDTSHFTLSTTCSMFGLDWVGWVDGGALDGRRWTMLDLALNVATQGRIFEMVCEDEVSLEDYTHFLLISRIEVRLNATSDPGSGADGTLYMRFFDASHTLLGQVPLSFDYTYLGVAEGPLWQPTAIWEGAHTLTDPYGDINPVDYDAKVQAVALGGLSGNCKYIDVFWPALDGRIIADCKNECHVCVDGGFFFRRSSGPVSYWHTTDYTDSNIGPTVVAAGSSPPKMSEGESDGDNRAFLYYDPSEEVFLPIEPRSETYSVLGEVIATGDDGTDYSGTLAHTTVSSQYGERLRITDGTQILEDRGDGTLRQIAGGTKEDAGTIDYDTGAWTASFADAVTSGVDITADYSYYVPLTLKPRFVFNFYDRLVLANIYDGTNYYPASLYWSDVADLKTYDVTRNYRDSVDSDTSPYVGGTYIDRYLFLARYNSLELLSYVGGDTVFGLTTVWQDGTYAGRTVINYQNMIYFLGKDDIMRFDGSHCVGIGEHRVRNKIFGLLNNDKLWHCFVSAYSHYNEVWFWIVKTGEEYPSSVFVYNVQMDRWSYFEFQPTCASGNFHTRGGTKIGELIGTIGEQHWRFSEALLEGQPEALLISDAGGDVFVLDGRLHSDYGYYTNPDDPDTWTSTPIPYRLVTRDFYYADEPRKDRTTRLHFEASGDEVTVSYSRDYGSTYRHARTVSLSPGNARRHYWLDTVAEKVRFKLEGTGSFIIRWLQTFAVVEEKD